MKGVNHVPGFYLGARASRPHAVPLAAAELQCDAAGSHPVGGNSLAWERGRPARMLSNWLPLSFSAMLQAATLPAGTPSARPKESHGAVTV